LVAEEYRTINLETQYLMAERMGQKFDPALSITASHRSGSGRGCHSGGCGRLDSLKNSVKGISP
jgi:hypothetical protein